MKVEVTYKNGNKKVLLNVSDEQMDKIATDKNIIRYEILSYF